LRSNLPHFAGADVLILNAALQLYKTDTFQLLRIMGNLVQIIVQNFIDYQQFFEKQVQFNSKIHKTSLTGWALKNVFSLKANVNWDFAFLILFHEFQLK